MSPFDNYVGQKRASTIMESAHSFNSGGDQKPSAEKVPNEDIQSDLSINEQRGNHNLVNRRNKGATLDQKLDKDEIDQDLLLRNITEMIKAELPIVSFPESQIIIDEKLLKEKKNDAQVGVQMENLKG